MIYRPSRAPRRQASGKPCTLCGRRLHHLDVVAAADETNIRFAHAQCVDELPETTEESTSE